MKIAGLLFVLCLATSCAHTPRCGNPEGARTVLTGSDTCQVRIRQVTIGSELKIPKSLKGPELSEFKLDWVESDLKSGRIEFGHFVLIPVVAHQAEKR